MPTIFCNSRRKGRQLHPVKPNRTKIMSSPARFICSLCGDTGTEENAQCKRVRYGSVRCTGYYYPPQYLIFDLATGKYLARGELRYTEVVEWAGVYDAHDLNLALEFTYGTFDRQIVARRATIILVK